MPAPTDSAPGATIRRSTIRVVCFEEAAECTLARIAAEALPGDTVLALGPERWALDLPAFGLDPAVRLRSVGRSTSLSGAWSADRALEAELSARSDAPRLLAYGPRAAAIVRDALGARKGLPVDLAGVPEALPSAPVWPEGRRARIRRELGLAPHEFGVVIAGEPSEWIDPSFAMRAFAMARVAGVPLRPIFSPRTSGAAAASAFLARASGATGAIVDARVDRPWEILPAVEAAFVDADGALSRPVECAGWRSGRIAATDSASPLPALWALACGRPLFMHASVELGAHASHPLVVRFVDDVAAVARAVQDFARSASTASR
ncbi:MAG: hypothetical protein ACKO0W_13705 [Planctomycetota bacterium]